MNNKHLEKFKELIKDIRIGVLITQMKDKQPKGRPMSTARVDDDGNLWYFTNEFSAKVKDISKDNQVVITYASPSDNSYVTVLGEASVVENKLLMQELWNPAVKAWFPKGIDDPRLTLLKVEPHEIEYWDGSASTMVILFSMLKAIVTGKEYSNGEHQTLTV